MINTLHLTVLTTALANQILPFPVQDCALGLHSIGWLDSSSLLLSGDDVDEPGKSVLLLASWDSTSGGSLHLREQFGREPGVAEPSQGPAMHFAIVPEWRFVFNSDARLETAFVHALGGFLCRVNVLLSTAVHLTACLCQDAVPCLQSPQAHWCTAAPICLLVIHM